ncbi:hypothetical protein MNBD_ALPHA12-2021, partial [hydrothermal vent metagenome]
MSDIRGLVISPPIIIDGTKIFIRTMALDPQQLRANLLFWDKLDFPSNNAIHIQEDQNATFLIKSGILKRTAINVQMSGDMALLYLNAHFEAFHILDKQEPGVWSL